MGKILGPVAKRLLKWLLKHGQEELDKELERRGVGGVNAPGEKSAYRSPVERSGGL